MTDAELLSLLFPDLSEDLVPVSLDDIRAAEAERARNGLRKLRVTIATEPLPVEEEDRIRRVPESRMAGLDTAMAALEKRARRLGVAPPSYEVLRTEDAPKVVTLPLGGGKLGWCRLPDVARYTWIRAESRAIALDGWTFCATIEHLGEEGNLLRVSPGFSGDLPKAFRSDPPTCDHCRTLRRRKETFVLQHKDGRMVRIGRSCLKDFLGDRSADGCVAMAEMDLELLLALDGASAEEGGWGGGGGPVRLDPTFFLSAVALVIAEIGWLSRGAARKLDQMGTADVAFRLCDPPAGAKPMMNAKGEVLSLREITDSMVEEAKKAIFWAQNLPKDVDSDYLYNLRLVAHLGAWSFREAGLGAAILMSYQKEEDRLRRLRIERALPSVHLGRVGDRFGVKKGRVTLPKVRATVLSVSTREGDFGLTTIVRMQASASEEGVVHDLIWFASGTVDLVVDALALAKRDAARAALSAAREVRWNMGQEAEAAKWMWLNEKEAKLADWLVSPEKAEWDARLAPLIVALEQASVESLEADAAAEGAVRPLRGGDVVDLVGTVAAHTTYGDHQRASTKLRRCSLSLVPSEVSS